MNHKTRKRKSFRVFAKHDFSSGDGFVTKIWGPPMWHVLHTISFNYPVHPTDADKKNYHNFIYSLTHVLPCKKCRTNLTNTFKTFPLRQRDMKSRETFSRFVYLLHEKVNTLLGKKSGLSYGDVRERYEHFRARCITDAALKQKTVKRMTQTELGCTEPLYGNKAKCVLNIVPQTVRTPSIVIDRTCLCRK